MLLADLKFKKHPDGGWHFAVFEAYGRTVRVWRRGDSPEMIIAWVDAERGTVQMLGSMVKPLDPVEAQCVVYALSQGITPGGDDAAR